MVDSIVEQSFDLERQETISSLVDKYYPEIEQDTYVKYRIERVQASGGDIDDEVRGLGINEYYHDLSYRNGFIETLEHSKVEDKNLPTYLETVDKIEQLTRMSWDDGLRHYEELGKICKRSPTIEHAQLYLGFSKQWHQAFVEGRDLTSKQKDRVIHDLHNVVLNKLVGADRETPLDLKSPKQLELFFNAFTKGYQYLYSLPNDRSNRTILHYTVEGSLIHNDPHQVDLMVDLWKQANSIEDEAVKLAFREAICQYSFIHGLTDEEAKNFAGPFLSLLKQKHSSLSLLFEPGNIWGSTEEQGFGIADFTCLCQISEINPFNLQRLCYVFKELPTADYNKFRQNVADAEVLDAFSGQLRRMIHFQDPKVHELITHLSDYYDGRGLLTEDRLTKEYGFSQDNARALLDRNNWDKSFTELLIGQEPSKQENQAINILRRLESNTRPIDITPPLTTDKTLNQLMNSLTNNKLKFEDQKLALAEALDYTNQQLLSKMRQRQIGIQPTEINALIWLEKQAMDLLKSLPYEGIVNVFKEPWFKSVCLFHELTQSGQPFNGDQWDKFYQATAEVGDYQISYKVMLEHVLQNMAELQVAQKEAHLSLKTPWSGNLTDTLIFLLENRKPQTTYGKQHQKEFAKRLIEPHYHPGD